MVHLQSFFYEDIMDPKWIFVIHYDPRLRHVFDDVSMNIEQNNDIQPIPDERLENNEEMTTHGDVQDEDVETQEVNMKMFKHNMTTFFMPLIKMI